MSVALITPNRDYEDSYREYIRELGAEERYPFPMDFDHADFAALLDRLAGLEFGRNPPIGGVASSTYWLVEDGALIGVSNLRHELNDELRACGGHIGLGVRPSQRGRGLGTFLMALTLQEARKRGIEEVQIHCHKHNQASARMIEANGGVLHSEIEVGTPPAIVQRFVVVEGAGLTTAVAVAPASARRGC